MIMLASRQYVRRLCTRSSISAANYVQNQNPSHTQMPILLKNNAQIRDFVKGGQLEDARQLFDEMPHRDEVSWTNIISGYVRASDYAEALDLFSTMWVESCVRMDQFVLSTVLKACGLGSYEKFGQLLHCVCVKNGLDKSVFVGSALLDMYAKTGRICESCRVFDEIPEKNVVAWTAIITGLVKAGYCKEGLMYFSDMWCFRLPCDAFSFAIALKACSDLCDLIHGKEIHAQVLKKGFDTAAYVVNTLGTMYNRCGKLEYGKRLFGGMRVQDVVSWTSQITSYAQTGKEESAVREFMRMRQSDVKPNAYTFAAVLSACANLGKLILGEQLHSQVTQLGFVNTLSVGNSVLTLYSKCGKLDAASVFFHAMVKKDIVSWSSIISGYSQSGYGKESFEYFSLMRREGPEPTEYAMASVLSASGSMAILEQGRQLHGHILKVGLVNTSLVQSALITMYSKCGSIKDASEIYSSTLSDDVVCWTCMVNGYADHGHSQEAIDLFEKMIKVGLKPDAVTFVGVLSACSHAGLVDLGYHFFNMMGDAFQIRPSKEHYGCMIDLLCRAGMLDKAENMINSMPCGRDDVVWSTLLRAAKAHGDADLGRRAAERILEQNPDCAGTLTTLANIYLETGKPEEAARVRKLMKSKGVIKDPGSSWIKLKDKVSSFVSRDISHPQSDHIYNVIALLHSGTDVYVEDIDALTYEL